MHCLLVAFHMTRTWKTVDHNPTLPYTHVRNVLIFSRFAGNQAIKYSDFTKMSHRLHLLHQKYHKCQKNALAHVIALLPKMTQPVKTPTTTWIQSPESAWRKERASAHQVSSDLPHSCQMNKYRSFKGGKKKYSLGSGEIALWLSICLAHTRTWVQFPLLGAEGLFLTSFSPQS